MLLVGIVIAILNTYTDVFEETLKPKPRKKPVKSLDYADPKKESEDTPAKLFTAEVMEEYPNLLKVSAQITLGSTCTAQISVSASTYAQYLANVDRTRKILNNIRGLAVKHAHSPGCKIDVIHKQNTVMRAVPKNGKTSIQKIKR